MAEFDQFSTSYEQDLADALSATGEDQGYFARGRVRWLAKCLHALNVRCTRVLDFGCGNGSNSPTLVELLGADQVLGIDVSDASISVARSKHENPRIAFKTVAQFTADGTFDLVFCNGVFHHIHPTQRSEVLTTIRTALRPAGLFAFWENNPWNPGTKYVMSQCVFDKNAITISVPHARKLLHGMGFEILRTDSLFYFPAILRALRPLEPMLRWLPLGGQYQILARTAEIDSKTI